MPDESTPSSNQIAGTFWGLLIGNALGAPLEGLKSGHIRQLFGEVHGFIDPTQALHDKPWRWRRSGLHTDDGQQALLLVDALLQTGGRKGPEAAGETTGDAERAARETGPRPHGVVRRLARSYVALGKPSDPGDKGDVGGHRGTGGNFRAVLRCLAAKLEDNDDSEAPWGCGQFSAGTGAAMRIGPLGVWTGTDSEVERVRLAIDVSLLTHTDPRGISAAVALALGVSRLARLDPGRRLDTQEFMSDLIAQVYRAELRLVDEYGRWLEPRRPLDHDCDLSRSLGVVASLVREGNDDLARRTIVSQAQEFSPEMAVTQPNHGFAPAALPMAFYRALSAPSFPQGLEATVADGGDADTMGAMVGALLGARFGIEAIPAEWQEGLVARRIVGQRAEALAEGYRVTPWEDLIPAEIEWTRDEKAARASLMEAVERDRRREGSRAEMRQKRHSVRRPSVPPPPRPSPPGQSTQDLPFAPPPEIWLWGGGRPQPPEGTVDPREKQKQKSARGKKRIPWKEDRRQHHRRGKTG